MCDNEVYAMNFSQYRVGTQEDIAAVAQIYEDILNGAHETGWLPGVYPVRQTAQDGELYVCQVDGRVVAAAKINQEQVDVYAQVAWEHPSQDQEVLVIHTLVVAPDEKGKGYGRQFIQFYEDMAMKMGCPSLRLDTNAKNLPARRFYEKQGYKEVGCVPCTFCGIPNVQLVCLEKMLPME